MKQDYLLFLEDIILIHGHFSIDYELVWRAIQVQIPQTKTKLQTMLEELKRKGRR